jgi:hypothetical protein
VNSSPGSEAIGSAEVIKLARTAAGVSMVPDCWIARDWMSATTPATCAAAAELPTKFVSSRNAVSSTVKFGT